MPTDIASGLIERSFYHEYDWVRAAQPVPYSEVEQIQELQDQVKTLKGALDLSESIRSRLEKRIDELHQIIAKGEEQLEEMKRAYERVYPTAIVPEEEDGIPFNQRFAMLEVD